MKEYQEFCLAIIEQHFGELGRTLAEALIRKNGQTIPELVQATSIDPERIILGLTTMIKFDVIRCGPQRIIQKPQLKDVTAAKKAKLRRPRTKRQSADDETESEEEELNDDYDYDGYIGANAVPYGTNVFGSNEENLLTPQAALANSRRINIPHPVITRRPPGTIPEGAIAHPPPNSGPAGLKRFSYYLDLNIVRGVTRFPRYLTMMYKAYGDEGLAIMQEFVTRGKLTLEQAIAASVCNLELKEQKQREKQAQKEAETASAEDEKEMSADSQPALSDLVGSFASVQQRVVSVFNAMLKERYFIYSNGYFDESLSLPQSKSTRRRKTSLSVDDGEDEDAPPILGTASAPRASKPFVINHERFSADMRADLIQSYVARRISPAAGVVVRCLLQEYCTSVRASAPLDPNSGLPSAQQTTKFPYLTPNEICGAVNKFISFAAGAHASAFLGHSPASITALGSPPTELSQRQILAIIEELSDPNIGIVQARANRFNASAEYALLPERILQQIRLEQAQLIVKERCGPHAARIFRLLNERVRLEEKQVSDFALLPKKETKCALYSMFEAQLVELQEVPRTSDRQPSKAFFLWSLPHDRLCSTILRYLYSGFRNAQLRLAAETSAVQSVLDKNSAGLELTEEESRLGSQWAQAFTRLDSSLRGYAMLIFLFRDLTP